MHIDPKGLAAFSAILRCASFDKAAQHLCITPSAISQRLKLLEEKIGQTLIIRTPPLRPTPAGAALLKYAQQLEQLNHTLAQTLEPTLQHEWLAMVIAVNADTLATWLLDCLAPWCVEHKVLLQLRVDDQDQTHHLLQQGEVTACISSLDKVSQGCRCVSLGCVRYHCVVSPTLYQQHFSQGVTAERLSQVPMVRFNHKDDLQHAYLRRYFELDGDQFPQHILPAADSYLHWIRLGMGFGLTPEPQVRPLLNRGELIELTPHWPFDVPLYWHQWGLETPLSKSLTHAIQRGAQAAHV